MTKVQKHGGVSIVYSLLTPDGLAMSRIPRQFLTTNVITELSHIMTKIKNWRCILMESKVKQFMQEIIRIRGNF